MRELNTALVLGASGGLAHAIVNELIADAEIDTVVAVSRKSAPESFTGTETSVPICGERNKGSYLSRYFA
jgi:uncharacterized protein YbjT (DUF2867 family)